MSHHYRECSSCLKEKPLDGGCELSPIRWLCVTCWQKFMRRKLAA